MHCIYTYLNGDKRWFTHVYAILRQPHIDDRNNTMIRFIYGNTVLRMIILWNIVDNHRRCDCKEQRAHDHKNTYDTDVKQPAWYEPKQETSP